jgi:cysteinyl-tRNA synthetase
MTQLRLFNTLSKTKEDFVPIDRANVRMYVCGPTVYDYAHIGNARPVIVFDVLYRLLKHLYPGTGKASDGSRVEYVRNITDVDDKINARAAAEGISIRELTEKTAQQYVDDVTALGNLPPTQTPRATDHIVGMIAMIETLIKHGNAYVAEGHVLFDVSSKHDYGKLSRRTVDDMIAGARIDVAPYKKNPMDFVMWKPSDASTPGWDSPWGRGRPGWHIECSAMAARYLGETFDIHGGGIDLQFPHHENEIAQSEGAHHGRPFANVWMHNGFLNVEGEKMSKSIGNFVTIRDLLTRNVFGGRVWSGKELRVAMLMTQYRQPIDWTQDRVHEARTRLIRWMGPPSSRGIPERGSVDAKFLSALGDDLNTLEAFQVLDDLATEMRSTRSTDLQTVANNLAATLVWLGIAGEEDFAEARAGSEELRETIRAAAAGLDRSKILAAIEARLAARKAKNFAESDRIRDELLAQGIVLKDTPQGTTWEVKR